MQKAKAVNFLTALAFFVSAEKVHLGQKIDGVTRYWEIVL
jgi:hypothetical protein